MLLEKKLTMSKVNSVIDNIEEICLDYVQEQEDELKPDEPELKAEYTGFYRDDEGIHVTYTIERKGCSTEDYDEVIEDFEERLKK